MSNVVLVLFNVNFNLNIIYLFVVNLLIGFVILLNFLEYRL